MKKRPDFRCTMKNAQAEDFRQSQVNYYLECKRLCKAEKNWIFTENYSEHGMLRFVRTEWGYGKGCTSATMIGYVQNMEPDDVLREVNTHAASRSIPSLTRAATEWVTRNLTCISQLPLPRKFDTNPIQLYHFWMDLRHCRFELPSDQPPQSAAELSSSPQKSRKRSGSIKRTKK
jgi:hypothetical protein